MVSSNPYAPPKHDELGDALPRGNGVGFALSGDVLICDLGASLPRLCVFSGEPTEGRISRKLSWAPQWSLTLAAVSPLIGFVVYMFVRKTGQLEYGLSEAAKKRKTSGLLIAIGGGVGGVVLASAGAGADLPALALVGGVLALVAVIVGAVRAQLLRIVKIDKQHIQLKLRPAAAQSFARHLGLAR
ncbi:MAG TPA: hypothetical protein VEQ58_21235 [Polyangiaceae bacterium]|nr:hypothetical protein [Polyangiaceae bacterium]